MSYQIWEPEHLCPLSILLTTSGSRGYKLLFQYPTSKQKSLKELFETTNDEMIGMQHKKSRSSSSLDAFSLELSDESGLRTSTNQDIIDASINSLKPYSYIENDKLSADLKEDPLVSLLAVKNNISKEKFYLKLEDVIFIGHLCGSSKFTIGAIDDTQTVRAFNVVFALRSTAPKMVQESFYILAKSIASAVCLEEKRCRFLSEERSIIQNISEDLQEKSDNGQDPSILLLEKSQLCRDLKQIVDEVSKTGFVYCKINNMATLCHCIPPRIYHVVDNIYINSSSVIHAANNIKPYHTLIFLTRKDDIISSLPVLNPDFRKFLSLISLKESVFTASIRCSLPLSFCLRMSSQLVLWGRAIIAHPLQDSNLYWPSPCYRACLRPRLLADFHRLFPTVFLPRLLHQLSQYQPLADVLCGLPPLDDDGVARLLQWLLINRLVYQVHRYYTLVPGTATVAQLLADLPGLSPGQEDGLESDSVRLIAKVLPLCTGDHHLDEITFQVKEVRTEVARVLEHFARVLVVVERADPVTSCFVGVV